MKFLLRGTASSRGRVCATIIFVLLAGGRAFAGSVLTIGAMPFAASEIVHPLSQGSIDWRSFAPYVGAESTRTCDATSLAALGGVNPQRDSLLVPSEDASAPAEFDEERPIDWRTIVPDLIHDQRAIWTFPARLAKGEDWKPTLAFVVVLGALIALDQRDTPYFHQTTAFAGFNRGFTGVNTAVGTLLVPPLFYAVGKLRKDSYTTETSLLMAESIVDVEALAAVLKVATGRRRPYDVPPGGNYADTWFETYHPFPNLNGTFPSGHTVMAFAVATIISRRYPTHHWVPFVAYGAASVIAFSRLSQQAHFPSDIFAGAAFGYVVSRYVVLPGRDPGN
jgi:membrane-associated phospholipid phosphatase